MLLFHLLCRFYCVPLTAEGRFVAFASLPLFDQGFHAFAHFNQQITGVFGQPQATLPR